MWKRVRSALDDWFARHQQFMLGRYVTEGTDSLSGAGALSTDTQTTKWTTTGANAGTLADGFEGQTKYIVMVADGGDGTLTPTNFGNGTTLTFGDVGDSVQLQFLAGEWWVLANNGVVVA